MSIFINSVDRICEWAGNIFSYLIWIGAAILAWEVISRYVFNAPTIWVHGYSQRIFAVYFAMIGAFTLLHDGHVRIDLFIDNFGAKGRVFFDFVNMTFLLIWTVVLTLVGWEFFWVSWKIKEVDEMALSHPVYPIKFALFLGALLLALQAVAQICKSFIRIKKGEGK